MTAERDSQLNQRRNGTNCRKPWHFFRSAAKYYLDWSIERGLPERQQNPKNRVGIPAWSERRRLRVWIAQTTSCLAFACGRSQGKHRNLCERFQLETGKPPGPRCLYQEAELAVAVFVQNKSKIREGKRMSQTEPNRHASTNKAVSFPAKTSKDTPRTPQTKTKTKNLPHSWPVADAGEEQQASTNLFPFDNKVIKRNDAQITEKRRGITRRVPRGAGRPPPAMWPAEGGGGVHEQEDQRKSPRWWWWFMCLRVCACISCYTPRGERGDWEGSELEGEGGRWRERDMRRWRWLQGCILSLSSLYLQSLSPPASVAFHFCFVPAFHFFFVFILYK